MAPNIAMNKAAVKQVLSGDSLVLQSTVRQPGKPPLEKTLALAYVSAPRLKREGDEPFAFQAREFVREKLLGKVVKFGTLYTIPTTQREYGLVELEDGSSLTELLVSEGWVKVREEAGKKDEPVDGESLVDKLRGLEEQAKRNQKGIWGSSSEGRIECANETPADPQEFLNKWKGKKVQTIVERVISGDRVAVRLMLDPKHHQQTVVLIAGIRAPASARAEAPAEEFGNEAKDFVESRLLQRQVEVELVGLSPQGQFIANVVHPRGNIADFLLQEGLARCNDNHSTMIGAEMSKLRAAESAAKQKKLRLWRAHVVVAKAGFTEAVVARIFSPDSLIVRNKAGQEKKISLSSVRQPKPSDPKQAPFNAEAKEFLRKKLIGKKVHVRIDGKRPAQDGFEEREMATVTWNDKNVALVLVENGYASVIRHRREDEDRSPIYDELLQAEEKARSEEKGMHSSKLPATTPPIEASETLQKAKGFLSFLQRQKRVPAVVDFVSSGSRFKVFVPRENAKLTFVLSGIRAPRTARNASEKSEPFGPEAHDFANKRLLQRDVEIDVENVDKVGGFIGTLYIGRENFAKALLEEGLASVHAYSAEQGNHASELFAAENKAKAARKGLWENWTPEQDEDAAEEAAPAADAPAEKRKDQRKVIVSNVEEDGRLKVQLIGEATSMKLEKLTNDFRKYFSQNSAPLSGAPKFGQILGAKFTEDDQFYRAKVKSLDREKKLAEVVYIDYGNKEKIPYTRLRVLPDEFGLTKLKAQAVDAALSFVQFPSQEHYLADAIAAVTEITAGRDFTANVDFIDTRDNNTLFLTLFDKPTSGVLDTVNAFLVKEGIALCPRKIRAFERAYGDVLAKFKKEEDKARDAHAGIWEYGDITDD